MTSSNNRTEVINPEDLPTVIVDDPDIALNNVNQTHSVIYSYSGQGTLHGFSIEFSNQNIYTRLVIDGREVFDLKCNILDSLFGPVENHVPSDRWVTYVRQNDLFHFQPRRPFLFKSSVSIEARSNSNNNNRYASRYVVELTKD